MSVRKIKNISGSYIQKTADIKHKIPKTVLDCYNFEDLEKINKYIEKNLDKNEQIAVLKTIFEIYIWHISDWDSKSILAPIVDAFYGKNNSPVIVCPAFAPLCTEEEAADLDEEDAIAMLQEKMLMFGYDDEQVGDFIEKIIKLCCDWDVDETFVLKNLNNIGYNPVFGIRIIDYGFVKEFN